MTKADFFVITIETISWLNSSTSMTRYCTKGSCLLEFLIKWSSWLYEEAGWPAYRDKSRLEQ